MEKAELKPCPFCGARAECVVINAKIYQVRCTNCLAAVGASHETWLITRGSMFFENEDEAVEAWNRRAKDGASE